MAKTVKSVEDSSFSPIFKKVRGSNVAKKDPNAPKRAKSAYNIFAAAMHKIVKAENPSITPTDMMKEIGLRWKDVSDVDKAKYAKAATVDKERFTEEMENYSPPPKAPTASGAASGTPSASGKKVKAKKDPNAPKKARTAYILFTMEEGKKARAEDPALSATDVMKLMGQRWASCKDKASYEAKAAEDKERYTEEMKKYQG